MRKTLIVCIAVATILAISGLGQAGVIPGSINEIINGGFEDDWASWEHGDGLSLSYRVFPSDRMVKCTSPLLDLTLRQVVDESTNPLWNSNYHAKIIDLTVDIWSDTTAVGYGVRFALDWWDEDSNLIDYPTQLGDPDGRSDWVTYYFSDMEGFEAEDWITVNPFNQNSTLFAKFQPRWVSVEVELLQPGLDHVGVDNFIMTSQCVPLPGTVLLLGSGLLGIIGFRRRFKK